MEDLIQIPSVVETTANTLVLASDTLLVILTWLKTFNMWRESTRLGIKTPVVTLILRDGEVVAPQWIHLINRR